MRPSLRSNSGRRAPNCSPPRASTRGSTPITAIRSLARQNVRVMITDSAVGAQEENNLRHLVANLGPELARAHVVPFLTSKHSLEFCLGYADQTAHHGFSVRRRARRRQARGPAAVRRNMRGSCGSTCVQRHPDLELGGWANPADAPERQVGFLLDAGANADFYLTQIASHHQAPQVEAFLDEARRRGLTTAGGFRRVLLPQRESGDAEDAATVPAGAGRTALASEFAAGATPVDVCARTIRTLLDLGARHFYVSNLPLRRTAQTLNEILDKAGVTARVD